MEEVFLRVPPTNIKNCKNLSLCLIGRVETFSKERINLDCGETSVQVLTNSKPANDISQNDFIEVRGEQLSDNIIILNDYTKLGSDFDLQMYNKAVSLMMPSVNSYSTG